MLDFGPIPPVIGLTGPGGVGKSTVAAAIVNLIYPAHLKTETEIMSKAWNTAPAVVHIGQPLKDMLGVFLAAAGCDPASVQYWIYGDGKRRPCPELHGRTPTHAMQTLGTEWGREQVSNDLWLSIWTARAADLQSKGRVVINDSIRFQNEVDAIHELGGVVFNLVGRSGDLSAAHVSEQGVKADFDVVNAHGDPTRAATAILHALYVDPDALARHG